MSVFQFLKLYKWYQIAQTQTDTQIEGQTNK